MKIRSQGPLKFPCGAILIFVFCIVAPCFGFQIEIRNDKLSLEAHQVPLQTLLKQVAADHGITLRMDPAINPLITASFVDRNLEDGLKSILKPYNHALFWKSTTGNSNRPSSPTYRLDEIHVFQPGEKRRMVEIEAPQERTEPEAPIPVETNVIIKGNKVFVPVTLAYGDNEVQTTLLFDTGAGSIVLHQRVADQLGITEYQPSRGQGVGGLRIATKMTRLTSVEVGPHKKENLRADIVEFQGTEDTDYNGLLGMNFIRGLKFSIDFENQTIRWAP